MKNLLPFVIMFCCFATAWAQEQAAEKEEVQYTYATFKGTRLVNLHTIETLAKGTLEFRIAHRFGPLSSGLVNLYGLDGPATIQLRLDYAVNDRLMLGIGRSSERKYVDGFIKYRWLRQTWENEMPVSVTFLTSANITTERDPGAGTNAKRYEFFSNRLAYFSTVMVARKFTPDFSAQIAPIFIHYNLVDKLTDKNDMFSVATSARYKFTRSTAVTAEYIARVSPYTRDMNAYKNVLSLGFDIETGGHVFQVFLTNGFSINEVLAVPYTTASWTKNEMRLGFNVSRTFDVGGSKEEKKW